MTDQEAKPTDSHGRRLSECPGNKRGQYPESPVCCGKPQNLYFASTIDEPGRFVLAGYLLRCDSCAAEMPVDLFMTQMSGGWWREVL